MLVLSHCNIRPFFIGVFRVGERNGLRHAGGLRLALALISKNVVISDTLQIGLGQLN